VFVCLLVEARSLTGKVCLSSQAVELERAQCNRIQTKKLALRLRVSRPPMKVHIDALGMAGAGDTSRYKHAGLLNPPLRED
jgi:hypothetical protein